MSITPDSTNEYFQLDPNSAQEIPYVTEGVSAGFPSPAADFNEHTIDLNKELCKNPLATFYIKVKGNSMIGAGIEDKDILIVDRSLEPQHHKIAVCLIDGEFTVKRLKVTQDNTLFLMPENKHYEPIEVTEDHQIQIWGIVIYVIKAV